MLIFGRPKATHTGPGHTTAQGVSAPSAHFFDLGGPSRYSGTYMYLIGFEHCGAHFFDLGGPSRYSGTYLIGFEHFGAHFFDLEGPSRFSGNFLIGTS